MKCNQKLSPVANIRHIQLDILSTEWTSSVLYVIPKDWYIDKSDIYIPIENIGLK